MLMGVNYTTVADFCAALQNDQGWSCSLFVVCSVCMQVAFTLLYNKNY